MPAWLRARLARREERQGSAAGASCGDGLERDGSLDAERDFPAPLDLPTTVGMPERLEEIEHAGGRYALRRIDLPGRHRHGAFTLDEIAHAEPRIFELTTGDASLAELDLSRAVFLDTETTGLSGGAGTTVFMVGLGWFEGASFVLWQGFLRSPAEERALLAATAERVGDRSALVSFFGKSFDRHRLEDKMRLHGVAPPFAGLPHLDLYHPLRRLYGSATRDGRLSTMESTLCGHAREGDLPGSRAPEAWFDFLAGRPHRLEGVFRHNAEDVLSLVTLAAHLGRVEHETRADGSPLEGCPVSRAAALSRCYLARRATAEASRWLDRHVERAAFAGGHADAARESRYRLAECLRRTREHGAAEAAHFALAGSGRDLWTVRSLIALAMLAEHHHKDAARALALSRQARELLDQTATGSEHARLARELDRRTGRLIGR